MNSTLSITLSSKNVDNLATTYVIAQTPAHGVLSGSAPNLVYTPTSSYMGADSFTFKVNDSALATVSITVTALPNAAPEATAQSVIVEYNTATAITLAGTDLESAIASYTIVSGPVSGVLSGTAPDLTYTPDSNYLGSDSFTFSVNDGTIDSVTVATISITVYRGMYFCPNSNQPTPDYLWNSADNWYFDSGCTSPASRIPITGDRVHIQGTTFSDQPALISLNSFVGYLPASNDSKSVNISIAAAGTLNVAGGYWYGATDISSTVEFNGASRNYSTVKGSAKFFNDGSGYTNVGNFGIINGDALFDNSVNEGIVFGIATFNSSSNIGTIHGHATFNIGSVNDGVSNSAPSTGILLSTATFNGDSSHYGSLASNAVFNENSSNYRGDVSGNAIFNGNSYNYAGTVSGNAIFNNSSINGGSTMDGTFGIVLGSAIFNDTSKNDVTGVVNGTITWGAGNPNAP